MYKCNFCKEMFEKPQQMSHHMRYCVSYKKYKEEKFTKDFLEKEYNLEGKSAKQIAEENGLTSAKPIIKLLKQYNIETRNVSKSKLQDKCKERMEKTFLKNSGYRHNFCKGSPSRDKMEQRLFDEYGISNVFQRDDVKKKIKKTFIEKYGYDSPMKNPEFLKNYFDDMEKKHGIRYPVLNVRNNKKITTIHKKIVDCLKKNEIEFEIEKSVYPYFVDIAIGKKVIECNGDFWHANPKKYDCNDILPFPNGIVCAHEIWNRDKKRRKFLEKKGYTILYLWEDDIRNNIQKCEEKIWSFLK